MADLEKTEQIKNIEEKAYDLGFDGFGIASPKIEKAGENFSKWLSLGFAGKMPVSYTHLTLPTKA